MTGGHVEFLSGPGEDRVPQQFAKVKLYRHVLIIRIAIWNGLFLRFHKHKSIILKLLKQMSKTSYRIKKIRSGASSGRRGGDAEQVFFLCGLKDILSVRFAFFGSLYTVQPTAFVRRNFLVGTLDWVV